MKVAITIVCLHLLIAKVNGQINTGENMSSERFKKGWEKLKEVDGEAGERVVDQLSDISPALASYIIEYAFGDVYSREGLDLKSKEIAVVAALTAMGNAPLQLSVHIHGALNTGSTVDEVKEIILQMSVYAGFPNCINAMNTLKSVLKEREGKGGLEEIHHEEILESNPQVNRFERGQQALSILDTTQLDHLNDTYGGISPELVKLTIEFGYGDIFSRSNLTPRDRQIATIAALAAMGTAQPQLKFHIKAGLNIGLTIENIREIMLLMTVYAGFPAAINGTNALKEVVNEREKI